MIIISTQSSYDWSQAQVYRFAGEHVLFQTPCAALRYFHVDEAPVELVVEASMALQEHLDANHNHTALPLIYQGPAPFGDQQRHVTFRSNSVVASLQFEDELVCQVDFSHNHIRLLREGGFSNLINVELVTGPALMIVLACLKTYCLHASAVSTNAGVVAIAGESGVGKSTLAWQAGDGWMQLADDILPVFYDKELGIVSVSSQFPQLKLENATAPSATSERPELDYILRINPIPAQNITFRVLPKAESMLQFVRHTVAVKLFDEGIMRRHTKFANYMAQKIPMIELSYPRDLLQLTDLREQIVDYLHAYSQ